MITAHSSIQYGDIPTWFAGVGTTAAFFATVYLARRDNVARRKDQARLIIFYAEQHATGAWLLVVRNMSPEPIFFIMIAAYDQDRNLLSGSGELGILMPDADVQHPATFPYGDMIFRDNSGVRWVRDTYGHLDQVGSWWRGRVYKFNMSRRYRKSPQQ